ncbi:MULTISPECIES: helix-turn-helix domain-containing protein [Actinomadura]|uniref:Helix-turn-helix domain-containing protein n=1 Tax=Actinomadura yumaensis TaxID=111807 RepID=A0ABW2CF93_9ACTN|nr:helix-turn-helix transcriptional regulator [Actinomadura sp. J1-007]MWK34702.1 helix-turn-helix domain-containing protein [Actinomadura sp. J1-007]
MSEADRPTMRSRKLGRRLRQIREERNLNLQKAARLLNRTPSSLSKLETGKRGIRRPALENMLDRYGFTDPDEREALFTLARDATKRGWWDRYEGKVSRSTLDYISLETDASLIRSFQLHLVPGLLQNEDYARAVVASTVSLNGPPDIEGLTALRMQRQGVLRKPAAPKLWAIMSEAALCQEIGGPEVRRAQLQRLVAESRRSNVTLQVLPYAVGAHPGVNGSFTSLTVKDLSVVLVENVFAGMYLESTEEIRGYAKTFDLLSEAALPPLDSRLLIERLVSAV